MPFASGVVRRDDANDGADVRTMIVQCRPVVVVDPGLDELDRVPVPGARPRSDEERACQATGHLQEDASGGHRQLSTVGTSLVCRSLDPNVVMVKSATQD
ncbi:MAG TPA: hypothetical protein VD858_00445, partial [Reyranella sp.]|nr:hypothetical protein [Reyranella sp.]